MAKSRTTYTGALVLQALAKDRRYGFEIMDATGLPSGRSSEFGWRTDARVADAIDSDPLYGPRHDKERHMVGVEFEVVLEYKLDSQSECESLTTINTPTAF